MAYLRGHATLFRLSARYLATVSASARSLACFVSGSRCWIGYGSIALGNEDAKRRWRGASA